MYNNVFHNEIMYNIQYVVWYPSISYDDAFTQFNNKHLITKRFIGANEMPSLQGECRASKVNAVPPRSMLSRLDNAEPARSMLSLLGQC